MQPQAGTPETWSEYLSSSELSSVLKSPPNGLLTPDLQAEVKAKPLSQGPRHAQLRPEAKSPSAFFTSSLHPNPWDPIALPRPANSQEPSETWEACPLWPWQSRSREETRFCFLATSRPPVSALTAWGVSGGLTLSSSPNSTETLC